MRALRARILAVSGRITWLPPLLARVGLVSATAGRGKLRNLEWLRAGAAPESMP